MRFDRVRVRACALLVVAATILVGCERHAPSVPSSNAQESVVEPGFEPVAFLVGDWVGSSSEGTFDEHWIAPRGGIMLGVGREVSSTGGPTFFELMRIERREGALVLVPQPKGRPGQDFKLVRTSPGSFLFENPSGDHVVRLSYELRNDALVARVEYREGGRVEEFRMKRAAPRPAGR